MKSRYHKTEREEILAEAEKSESFIQKFMEDEYVHFIDAIPEIKEFLEELKAKETRKIELSEKQSGRQTGIKIDLASLRGE